MKNIIRILAIITCLSYSQSSFSTVNIQMNGGMNFTAVLSSGSVTNHYDIVFIGDGFTSADQAAFNTAVDAAVTALRNLAPYSTNMCAFNIWRVNVVSTNSGIDHPRQSIFVNTELDCRFGNAMEAERCIRSDSPAKCQEAAAYAPAADAIFVLVNDTQWGGCAFSLVFSSVAPGFAGIITHELGHKVASLADEYDCYLCDGTDNNRTYVGIEPGQVNITANSNRTTTKWAALINATTPIPTTVDNPVGVVGLWEGAGYYRFHMYRPRSECQMRNLAAFCPVCSAEMDRVLSNHCDYCQLRHRILVFCNPRWRDLIRYRFFDPRYVIRWPIPPCYQCPPFNLERGEQIKIILEGLDPKLFKVEIMDENNEKVAESNTENSKATEVSFKRTQNVAYSLQLSARSKEATGKLISSQVTVMINDKKVVLK